MLSRPLLGEIQALSCHCRITRDKFDLKLPGYGNQRCFELVVFDVVGIGGIFLARYDLVGR